MSVKRTMILTAVVLATCISYCGLKMYRRWKSKEEEEEEHVDSETSNRPGASQAPGTQDDGREDRARSLVAPASSISMDDFRYIDILGHGAYGMVDEAEHIESGTVVAIKHLMRNSLPPTIGEEFVQHEFQIQRSVTHPNIIRPYALFEDESAFHMVMQLSDGELGALMQINGGRLEEADAARILAGLSRAVDHCHSSGIIHRDIKVTNVLLDSEDNALLCDFGESVRVSGNERLEDYMRGTVEFMAPEMCNKRPYNHRVDIWSMGVVLYQMLVGKLPFKGRTKQETITKIEAAEVKFPDDVYISDDAKNVITGLLKKEPGERMELKDVLVHPWVSYHSTNA